MKKNRMMRLASLLLICVLLTTSVISGTYAKYVTDGTATDSARVAKFGVTVTATNSMFATEYDAGVGAKTVVSNADLYGGGDGNDNVVAPGTNGKLANFVLAGTPEVDVKVWYKAVLTLNGWKVGGNDYCPIIINVNGTDYAGMTMAELKTKVEAAINGYYNDYDANVVLADQTSNDLIVTWRWEYETGSVATFQDDVKDTALGDAAAAGNPATIMLEVTCTVEQID